MARVLTTFIAMLRERRFDELTMAEIARRSQTSLPSIYSRFKDKDALLLAAHELFKVESEARIDRLAQEVAEASVGTEDMLRACARHIHSSYAENTWLMRSALLSGNPVIYERIAQLMQRCSEQVAGLVRRRVANADASLDVEMDFALRAAFALLQQSLLFDGAMPRAFARSEAELPEHIAALLIAAARKAGSPGVT